MASWVLVLFLTISLSQSISGVIFYLQPNTQKCLRDELRKNVMVTGEYEVGSQPGNIDINVKDSKGHILFQKQSATKGPFAFTTEDYEVVDACFTFRSTGGESQAKEIRLEMKHGIEAKEYEKYAQAESLQPLEMELRRLEDLANEVVEDFLNIASDEANMRDTNESTHKKVLYFSIFSMCCLVGLAAWQIWYLRRYFQSKKII